MQNDDEVFLKMLLEFKDDQFVRKMVELRNTVKLKKHCGDMVISVACKDGGIRALKVNWGEILF